MKSKIRFVIVSFRQVGGGAIALHSLCRYLSELGYDARVFYLWRYDYKSEKRLQYWLKWIKDSLFDFVKLVIVKLNRNAAKKNPVRYKGFSFTPVKGCKRKFTPFIDKNTIVVYPEIMHGNPLNADKTVRWLLYHNKLYNEQNPDAYDENDLFFCYRKVFNDEKLNPDVNRVRTPFYDLDFYKQTNFGERGGKCYIIRKGADRNDLPEKLDGVVIDDMPESEIVEVFNKCKHCVSYDTQTAYSKIAAMCGCVSVIIPEQGKTKADYISSEDEDIGVAWGWGKEELKHAEQTQKQVREMFERVNESGRQSAREFAETCIRYFGF